MKDWKKHNSIRVCTHPYLWGRGNEEQKTRSSDNLTTPCAPFLKMHVYNAHNLIHGLNPSRCLPFAKFITFMSPISVWLRYSQADSAWHFHHHCWLINSPHPSPRCSFPGVSAILGIDRIGQNICAFVKGSICTQNSFFPPNSQI